MDELQAYLVQQEKELNTLTEQVVRFLKNAPSGSLRIVCKKNSKQYYWRTDPKDTNGRYINKHDEKLFRDLAKKEYAQKILEVIQEQGEKIRDLLAVLSKKDIAQIYEALPEAKKRIVTPYILPDREFICGWEEEKLAEKKKNGKSNYPIIENDSAIMTEKGERVRSKSEKILADKLYMMNIPYIYEAPLFLNGYGYINPDFTVMNLRLRKIYYWEHLGLMDDMEYCEKAIKKIELYEKNKIYPGKNLILTYETNKHTINTKIVEGLIQDFLL